MKAISTRSVFRVSGSKTVFLSLLWRFGLLFGFVLGGGDDGFPEAPAKAEKDQDEDDAEDDIRCAAAFFLRSYLTAG